MNRFWVVASYLALALAVAALGAYLAVSLVVEQAPEVEVPDVAGLGLAEALDMLTDQGLDLEVQAFVYSDSVPENRIVRQHPPAGKVIKAGRGVAVSLSRGPERHPVPDVRGLPLEDARILLGEAGLEPEVSARVHRAREGEVFAQGVDPGRRLPLGATVRLVVSQGPQQKLLRMPRLGGMRLDDAVSELDELGLRLGRVEEVSLEDPSLQGKVVSQEPLPGFPAGIGEGVILSVAGTARTFRAWRDVWISRALPPGFSRHRVEVLVEDGNQTWTVADTWMGGGEVFRRWIPARQDSRVTLRVNGEEHLDYSPAPARVP